MFNKLCRKILPDLWHSDHLSKNEWVGRFSIKRSVLTYLSLGFDTWLVALTFFFPLQESKYSEKKCKSFLHTDSYLWCISFVPSSHWFGFTFTKATKTVMLSILCRNLSCLKMSSKTTAFCPGGSKEMKIQTYGLVLRVQQYCSQSANPYKNHRLYPSLF